MGKKSTTEEFITKAKAIHGDRYDYSQTQYKNSATEVDIICPTHGPFKQKPTGHLQGFNCYWCSRADIGERIIRSHSDFEVEARKIHGDKYDYSKFIFSGSGVKGIIVCSLHGEFDQTPHKHFQGRGCPTCGRIEVGRQNRKGRSRDKLFIERPDLLQYWNYDKNEGIDPYSIAYSSGLKYYFFCRNGHDRYIQPNALVNLQQFCRQCNISTRTSLPETAIFYYLSKFWPCEQNFRHTHNTSDYKYYESDIWIPDFNTAIEFDGNPFHNKLDQVERDLKKNKYFIDNNINLIRLRQSKLLDIDVSHGIKIFQLTTSLWSELNTTIYTLVQYIAEHQNVEVPYCDVNIGRDLIEIYDLIDFNIVKNSLLEVYPKLAEEWHPTLNGNLTPDKVKAHSGKKMWWIYKCGCIKQCAICSRNTDGGSCIKHAPRKGANQFTKHANI